MLSYKTILAKLDFKENVINNMDCHISKKVLNINPYSDNNSHKYLEDTYKENNTYKISELIKTEFNDDLFLLSLTKDNNLYHCILSIFDNEYITNTKNVQNKDSEFLRLKLISDLDENYRDINGIKEYKNILNKIILVNNKIFLYLSVYFKLSFFIVEENKIYKYGDKYTTAIIFYLKNNYYYPVISNNKKIFEIDKLNQIDNNSTLISKVKNNNIILSLIEIQNIAKEKNINIMKKNKKGDKEIKKTKKELLNEIESL